MSSISRCSTVAVTVCQFTISSVASVGCLATFRLVLYFCDKFQAKADPHTFTTRKQLPCCSHSRVTVRDRILTPMFVCFRFRIESSAQLPRQTPARARHAPRTQRELQPCPKTSHTILSALPLQHVLVAVVCVIVLLLSLSHQQP